MDQETKLTYLLCCLLKSWESVAEQKRADKNKTFMCVQTKWSYWVQYAVMTELHPDMSRPKRVIGFRPVLSRDDRRTNNQSEKNAFGGAVKYALDGKQSCNCICRHIKAQEAPHHVQWWWSEWAEMLMQFHAKISTKMVPPDLHKHSPHCAAFPASCKLFCWENFKIKYTWFKQCRESDFPPKYNVNIIL